MKKSLIFKASSFILCFICTLSFGKYSGGTGEPSDPYLISTPNDLNSIGLDPNDWDKHFKMIADINLSGFTGTQFNIIGGFSPYFSGSFDGNGFSVIEFTYDSNDEDNVGLFGVIDSTQAEVKNLLLVNPSVTVNSGMFSDGGTLVGSLSSGSIMRCKISGGQVTGYNYPGGLGGLVGFMDNGLVNDCNVTCVVTGNTGVGGIVGKNSGQIVGCHFDGDVSGRINIGGIAGENDDYIAMCSSSGTVTIVYSTGTRHNAGGLVGENRATVCFSQSSATVTGGEQMGGLIGSNYFAKVYESYATGMVSGSIRLGGLIGKNHYSVVTNCYAVGSVSGNSAVGGLIGTNSSGHTTHLIKHCYSAGHVSGSTNVGGLIGYDDSSYGDFEKCFWDQTINPSVGGIGNSTDPDVIGQTTFNMKLRATYESVGWDFVWPIWYIKEGIDYPKLFGWEGIPGDYGGGTGTPGDPYLIYTPEQLNMIARDYASHKKHFKLMTDIDMSIFVGEQFNMIGDETHPFIGVFDGNNHNITNFTYITEDEHNVGLFGYVDQQFEIKNITIIEPEIKVISSPFSNNYIGAIVGHSNGNGRVENCHVIGGTIQGSRRIGGLAGSFSGEMYNCSSTCTMSGNSTVGGLCGTASGGVISRCHATGNVSCSEDCAGGLVGRNYSTVSQSWADCNVSAGEMFAGGITSENTGSIIECYSKGQITAGYGYVGGFVGKNSGNTKNCYSKATVIGIDYNYAGGFCGQNIGEITNCFSNGTVTGSSQRGGFVGRNRDSYGSGEILYCFWDVDFSGIGSSGDDNYGAIGKTTEQMQYIKTFLVWSCEPAWTIDDGNDYPHLIWENMPSQVIEKPTYGGGSGEPNDPYLIHTDEHLSSIGWTPCDANSHFILMNDIDMYNIAPNDYAPIGNRTHPFEGVFDGNNNTISNFTANISESSEYEDFGLFGYISSQNAHIKNINMISPQIQVLSPSTYTGALVGRINSGNISNCKVEDANVYGIRCTGILLGQSISSAVSIEDCNVTGSLSGTYYIGGLVGSMNGSITNCHASVNVSGNNNIGGLVGRANCTFTVCSSQGQVDAIGDYIGGLVGYIYSGSCSNCWTDCDVYSTGDYVGGFSGYSRGTISNCHVNGTVSGDDKVGGLLGENTYGDIEACYSTVSVTGSENVGGLIGDNYGTILQCWAQAGVNGYKYVGGLIGKNESQISESFATGNVLGDSYVGGFVGGNFSNSYARLENCYTNCNVIAVERAGGFVGYNDNPTLYCYSTGFVDANNLVGGFAGDNAGTILACYWDMQTSGLAISAGGIGKPTYLMKRSDTYVDWGSQSAWTIDHGNDYPKLIWQQLIGIPIVDKEYFTGHGTKQLPYLISNVQKFNKIGLVPSKWDKHFKLVSDIDLSVITGSQYNVIGKDKLPFIGTFDGQEHKMFNFNYESLSENYIGLFGKVSDPNSVISNIIMDQADINVPSGYRVGVLVGLLLEGTIENCQIINSKINGRIHVGGLAGSNYSGIIADCHTQCEMSGTQYMGGLVGHNNGVINRCYSIIELTGYSTLGGLVGYNSDTISSSYAYGSIKGESDEIGGLVGESRGTVIDCFAKTTTEGDSSVGGLIGYHRYGNITNCYSVGEVWGNTNTGGLVGYQYSSTDSNSFWDVNTSGLDISAAGTGLTTPEMQSYSPYFTAGWDFNDIWGICEGTNYPKFIWSIPSYDYLCPDGVDFADYAFLSDHWMETEYGDVNGIELNGDGIINYRDFASFAQWWSQTDCGDCGGVDFTGDGNVDWKDMDILSLYWLATDYGDCGGAEITYDGIVDWSDLKLLCENWLAE